MPIESSESIYPISVASKLLSVHPRTLRIYEDEGLIKPARKGNKRYYSNDDIEWIKCIRSLIHDKGISIPGIKMLLDLTPCWEIKDCPPEIREKCSAFMDRTIPCWERATTACNREMKECANCDYYIEAMKQARSAASAKTK